MERIMWYLILNKDYGKIVVQTFKTKREAEEELNNRKNLCAVLKTDSSNTYSIERATKNDNSRLGKEGAMPIVRL